MERRRLRQLVSVAIVGVGTAAVVVAQAPSNQRARRIRCFTPVSTQGVYFEVSADGPTARLLRGGSTANRVHVSRFHPPPEHAVSLRSRRDTPTLLAPVAISPAAPAVRRHTHGSAFDMVAAQPHGTSGVTSPMATTGCTLILR